MVAVGMLAATAASAITVPDGVIDINDGAVLDGTVNIPNSAFANEIGKSQTLVPVSFLGGANYYRGSVTVSELSAIGTNFVFYFDAQETNQAGITLQIDDIVIATGNNVLWRLDLLDLGPDRSVHRLRPHRKLDHRPLLATKL